LTTSRLPVVADLAPVPFTPGLTLATTTAPALIDPNVKTVVPIPVHPVDCAAVTRKTIARWIAHKLNEPAMATQTDLAGAFKDGTLLARLLNVLTGETIEVIPDPVKDQDALSNLCACFKFMKAAGIDTRRISFTDFSSCNADRVSTLFYRLILWNEFDSSWAEGAEPMHVANADDSSMPALWNGCEHTIPKAFELVGGLEKAASAALLNWMQTLREGSASQEVADAEASGDTMALQAAQRAVMEAAESPTHCAIDLADGHALCTLVALEHQRRFGQQGWAIFESLFSISKFDDWFRVEDSTAAQKCDRAMKVLERVLKVPALLDPEEVGRCPTSLTIYLAVARTRISALHAHECARAESKEFRRLEAIEEQQQLLALQAAEDAAMQEARRVAQQKQAEAEAALAAAELARHEAIAQAEVDKKLRLQNAEIKLKNQRQQALTDLRESNRIKLEQMNKQLQIGLVSLESKHNSHATSLLNVQSQESDDCMSELAQRVAAQKQALNEEKQLITKVRDCDSARLTSQEQLEEADRAAAQLSLQIKAQATQQEQRVASCDKWVVESYDQIADAQAKLDAEFERGVALVCHETELTEQVVKQSRQAHQNELHCSMKDNLEAAAADRKWHDAARDSEMEKLSMAETARIAEQVDNEYRGAQRDKADYLASDASALSPVTKLPALMT